MAELKPFIAKIATGAPLERDEARAAFDVIMAGDATPAQIGGFLMALRVRGETVDEIAGAIGTMRARMLPVEAPADAVDIVGTGGDNVGTYNISTCSAFVVAASGVPVAKHGNRALSSKSGAADVLTALGVVIDLPPERIAAAIRETGVGFMFAPAHHSAMKHVGPARVELGTRTVFNLVGPLSNPASVRRQLVGVYDRRWIEPVAIVLAATGSVRSWVVHGSDGLDEMTVTGPTFVASLENGTVSTFEVTPESVGLARWPLEALKGGDAGVNAGALRAVLSGAPGAYRDIVRLNAGGALLVAGRVESLAEGVALAGELIDSGAARERLDALVALTNRPAAEA